MRGLRFRQTPRTYSFQVISLESLGNPLEETCSRGCPVRCPAHRLRRVAICRSYSYGNGDNDRHCYTSGGDANPDRCEDQRQLRD